MAKAEIHWKRRAEISGWNVREEFFVERAELIDSEDGLMHAFLETSVAIGSLVFVRPMDQAISAIPLPFRITKVEGKPSRRQQVILQPYRNHGPDIVDLARLPDWKLSA